MKLENLRRYSINPIVGIYFLFNKKNLIYVGKSTDIWQRVQQHKQDKVFDSFGYKECLPKNLDKNEKRYIKMFSPKFNQVHKDYVVPETRPDKLSTPEFENLYNSCEDNFGFLFEDYFIFKFKGELIYSRLFRDKNKRSGYIKFGFRELKGEIITNNSAIMKRASGWFKYKNKTIYFKPEKNGYSLTSL